MKNYIKTVVSGNTLLYYIWFKLVRQRTGDEISFFDKGTNLYIDGYPRSGNTFLTHLSRQLLPELKFAHHFHTVAAIKIAFMKNLPVFILIRNPMDAISSKYLKHFAMKGETVSKQIDIHLLNEFINDYLYYYKFVLDNKNMINIIKFKQLIDSPKIIVNDIADKMEIEKRINDKNIADASKLQRGATDTFGSFKPNEKKEYYKNIIKKDIGKSAMYPCIKQLYESITGEN